ncbi:MAG: hypothetical protein RLY20_2327 [Verrucomicrobiota bacterium]|jgi:hypothetical protein
MNLPALTPKSAWLPVTPRGVAAFALAKNSRLLLVQFMVAIITACCIGWFLHQAWAPAIREAIAKIPDDACIQSGALSWPTNSPVLLSEQHFLGITVDLDHTGQMTPTSHLQIELGKNGWQVSSLLGVLDLPSWVSTKYPADVRIALNRSELEPWWAAREPFLILIAMAGVVVWLMMLWPVLGVIYSAPVWLVGFFSNRALDWRASWRLGCAVLMPGALLMSASIVLYGLRAFDLMKLAVAFGLHLVVGWVYLIVSPLFLGRHPDTPAPAPNPFHTSEK